MIPGGGSDEFKIEAVKQVTERGHSVADVAQRLGITTHSLYAWRAKFDKPDVVRQVELDQSAEARRLKAELKRVTAPGSARRCTDADGRGRLGVGYARKGGCIDPHRDVTSVDQAGVAGRPVPDTIARLRLARLALVPAHLHAAENRESTHDPELLKGVPDRLLWVNVSRPLARPIYATMPQGQLVSCATCSPARRFTASTDGCELRRVSLTTRTLCITICL